MIAILQNIRSMHNVGSIFRTAGAAGVEKLYLCGITPEPIDRFGKSRSQILKVSLGAEKSVSWEKCLSAVRLIRKLKSQGFKILAIEQNKKSIPYFKFNNYTKMRSHLGVVNRRPRLEKVALVFGNEVKGLNKAILDKSDKILEIPIYGKKESLNVAVAFGVVVFYLVNLGHR